MLPTVWPGDTLVIEGIGLDVSEGDIVLFSRNHLFVAHRVVAKLGQPEDPRVLTRGDAMVASDSSLSEHELLGRVSRIQRNGRSVEPNRNLGVAARAVSALVRRSQVAARLLAGVHGIQRASLG
jgi:hypothetical protein